MCISGHRRHRGVFVVAAAAVALATANVTAYSGIVIDPVVITFAFLVWLPDMRGRRTALYTICLSGSIGGILCPADDCLGLLVWICCLPSSHAKFPISEPRLTILSDSWGYAGMLVVLAIVGSIIACSTKNRRSRASLLLLLSLAAFIVPAAQVRDQTAWSLDKHLAYGIWLAGNCGWLQIQ